MDAGCEFRVGERTGGVEVIGLQSLGRGQDGRDGHPVTLSLRDQFSARLIGEHLTDQGTEFVKRLRTGRKTVEARILELLGLPQPRPQPMPLTRCHDAEPDEAVAAGEDRVQILIARSAAPPLPGFTRRRRLPLGAERRIQREHHGVEPGEVDDVADTAAQPVDVGDQ